MFEQTFYKCPNCGTVIRQRIEDGQELDCASCRKRFNVMVDESAGKAALFGAAGLCVFLLLANRTIMRPRTFSWPILPA